MQIHRFLSVCGLGLLLAAGGCGLFPSVSHDATVPAPNDPSRAGDAEPKPDPVVVHNSLPQPSKPVAADLNPSSQEGPGNTSKADPIPASAPVEHVTDEAEGHSAENPQSTQPGDGVTQENASDSLQGSVQPATESEEVASPADQPPPSETSRAQPDPQEESAPKPETPETPATPENPTELPPLEPEEPEKAIVIWLAESDYNRLFDTGKVMVYEGPVQAVDTFVPEDGALEGLRLTIETSEGKVVVHVGPRVFVLDQQIRFNYQDTLRIRGCTVKFKDQTVFIASDIRKGEEQLKLRDDKGTPLWSADQLKSKPKTAEE